MAIVKKLKRPERVEGFLCRRTEDGKKSSQSKEHAGLFLRHPHTSPTLPPCIIKGGLPSKLQSACGEGGSASPLHHLRKALLCLSGTATILTIKPHFTAEKQTYIWLLAGCSQLCYSLPLLTSLYT